MKTYHPQTEGQAESFNHTILHGLRVLAGEHPETWAELASTVAYVYNTQVNGSTRIAPFDLAVTKPPGPLIMKRMPCFGDALTNGHHHSQLPAHACALVQEARTYLAAWHNKYKQNFDARVRP